MEPTAIELFFAGQDAADADNATEAEDLWSLVASAGSSEPRPPEEPPLHVIRSMAQNGIAELALDRALSAGFPLQPAPDQCAAASSHLRAALRAFPANATANMNAALLARDEGNAEAALEQWSQAASSSPDDANADEWREDWLYEPRRRCATLARLYRALLLSQLGRHDEATPELCALGFRWRLAPGVWDCARTPPNVARPLMLNDHAHDAVRMHADAVSKGTLMALQRAFAPGAAYWRETQYETASASKRYLTFSVDLDELAARRGTPAHAVDGLIRSLLPLTGRTDLRSCEWWVHERAAGRGFGHELHFDCEEATMETCGRVLHPAVSSVVYLTDDGDPTLILDETLDQPLGGSRAHVAHPHAGSFLAFDGELLHGVLPGAFAHRSGAAPAPQRLTLLIAWYVAHPRRHHLRRPRHTLGTPSARETP